MIAGLHHFLVLIVLSLAANASADSSRLGERIGQLELMGYEGSWTEVSEGLNSLAPELQRAEPGMQVRADLLRARMLAIAHEPGAAIELLEDVLRQHDQLDPPLILRALTLATNVLVFNERFEEGFHYFREALQLAPLIDDPESRVSVWIVAADFHGRIGEAATSIEYANRVLEELQSSELLRPRCVAMYLRGKTNLYNGDFETAQSDFGRATELCAQVPDRIYAGQARHGLAMAIRARAGDEAVVIDQLQRAVEDHRIANFVEGLLESHVELARIALEHERLEQAAEFLEPAGAWIDQVGSPSVRADALFLSAELEQRRGNLENAYRLTQRALHETQKHVTSLRQMSLTLLMSDLDDRSRETELNVLRARNDAIRLAQSNDRQDEIAAYWAGSGALLASILLCVVVLQTARDRKRFRELARLDGLTGLVNHTRFFELAQNGFQRARQSGGPFVLIIADIDLFKRINDEHGHLVGDAVLRRVGARFIEAFGKDAIIGRLGGEEIGVAMIDCDLDAALARLEHLRAILNRRRADDAEPEITMSFGVAELRREKSLDTLYAHADQALYDAKDAGRNRVVTVAPVDFGNAAFVT